MEIFDLKLTFMLCDKKCDNIFFSDILYYHVLRELDKKYSLD